MAPGSYTIKIPNTSTAQHPKPHTIYNITLALPLQTLTIQKRYSDFLDLHAKLTDQAGSAPPVSPPPKTYLPSFLGGGSSSNPTLIENRRQALEEYLQQIASENIHPRWRETSAWRAFLNLPSGLSSKSSVASTLRTNGTSGTATTDPALWLDTQREVKILLQEARKHVSARASADTAAGSHEESAEAKKLLVRAAGMISNLERGLKSSSGDDWGRERLGEGELRRRRDLVAQARQEKDDLERLLSMIGQKKQVEAVVEDLTRGGSSFGSTGKGVSRGRVLGKETAKTRELDNAGVLQLQQTTMQEQDEDVDMLTATVRKQKELAMQINEELVLQNEMLKMVDDDVTRLDGKIRVASKRVGKIS